MMARLRSENAIDGTLVARKIVEAAVRADLQVDGACNPGCEGRRLGWLRGIEMANPSAAVVGKKVPAHEFGELRNWWVIERAACNGASRRRGVAVPVPVNRRHETTRRRRPLMNVPPVVRAGGALIDFFPGTLSDVVDKYSSTA